MFTSRPYIEKLFAWIVLYLVLLVVSIWLIDAHRIASLVLRAIVGVLPMVAAFGILDLVMREYRTQDELQQKITCEGIMFGFGATAIVTFTYGFLERSGAAPALSYFFVWPILATSWIVGNVLARSRYR